MAHFLTKWLFSAIALGLVAWIVPAIHVDGIAALLVATIVLGFCNAVLKPLLLLLTLPLTIVTLGLFYFVLNALLFLFAAALAPGFHVDGFGWALLGSLLMGLFGAFLDPGSGKPRPER